MSFPVKRPQKFPRNLPIRVSRSYDNFTSRMNLNIPFEVDIPMRLAVYGQEEAIKSVSHMELTLKDTLRLHSSWPPRKAKY